MARPIKLSSVDSAALLPQEGRSNGRLLRGLPVVLVEEPTKSIAARDRARGFDGSRRPAVRRLETKSAMRALSGHNGGRPVVVTCGERGLLYGTSDDFQHLPAFKVQAIDTTAAGDVFHGAFAYGVLKGLALEETLQLAAAAAALSTTVRGGRTSIPSLARVEEFLAHAG